MDDLELKKLRHMEAMLYVQKFGQPSEAMLKMASSQGKWWLLEQKIHWALLDEKPVDWTDFARKLQDENTPEHEQRGAEPQKSELQETGLQETKLIPIAFDDPNSEFKELNQRIRTYIPRDAAELDWD